LAKGFTIDDSSRIADLFSTNHKAFVNIMMLEELGLVVIEEKLALKCGITTLISFMVLGALPAIPYIISSGIIGSDNQQLIAVIVIGVVELFSLGFAKASLIGMNPWKSGIETLLFGVGISSIGCGLGLAFSGNK
jgi:VIT1/CCC1 family predicted Fe2+/Mn2+ transporter